LERRHLQTIDVSNHTITSLHLGVDEDTSNLNNHHYLSTFDKLPKTGAVSCRPKLTVNICKPDSTNKLSQTDSNPIPQARTQH